MAAGIERWPLGAGRQSPELASIGLIALVG